MKPTIKAAATIAVMSAGLAVVGADDPAAGPPPTDVKQVAPSVEGQKIEEVKKVDAQASPVEPVKKEIVKPPAAQAVKGIEGLKGAKLENLKKALQLQANPTSSAAAKATGGKAVAAAAGLMTAEQADAPPLEPAPIQDARELPPEAAPDQTGGS